MRTMSNARRFRVSRASPPRPEVVTWYPSAPSTLAQLSRSVRSSSITSTRTLWRTASEMEIRSVRLEVPAGGPERRVTAVSSRAISARIGHSSKYGVFPPVADQRRRRRGEEGMSCGSEVTRFVPSCQDATAEPERVERPTGCGSCVTGFCVAPGWRRQGAPLYLRRGTLRYRPGGGVAGPCLQQPEGTGAGCSNRATRLPRNPDHTPCPATPPPTPG